MQPPRVFHCALIVAAAGTLVPAPALAGIASSREATCAVGGEEFSYTTTASYTIFGYRPDGKPEGSWTFPLALPDCPGNGLVMYRDFDEHEVEQLEDWLESPEFAAIREESQYYRAAATAAFLGADGPYRPVGFLLRATWEMDGWPDRKARYQREFVDAVANLPEDAGELDWIALVLRAANTLRELGEFGEATALLSRLPDRIVPSEIAAPDMTADERETWQSWAAYRTVLVPEIEVGNSEISPFNMLSRRQKIQRCIDLREAGASPDEMPPACNPGRPD